MNTLPPNSMKMIKTFLFCILFVSLGASAQKLTPVDSASKIHFVIKNFGINTGGDLSGLKGKITFSPSDLSACSFDVSVDASTVNTDNSMRDKSLTGEEYFDAARFPLLTITSTKIDKTNKSTDGFYYFTGNLTIKGVTKTLKFPFQAKEENGGYLFTGNFRIDRTDFGVGEQNIVLSNLVDVTLSVFAKKS
jgi:polyisoprenoid-binding protein YceI